MVVNLAKLIYCTILKILNCREKEQNLMFGQTFNNLKDKKIILSAKISKQHNKYI